MSSALLLSEERPNQRLRTSPNGISNSAANDLHHCAATLLADQGTPVHIVQRR